MRASSPRCEFSALLIGVMFERRFRPTRPILNRNERDALGANPRARRFGSRQGDAGPLRRIHLRLMSWLQGSVVLTLEVVA